jgi:hypothetical protein
MNRETVTVATGVIGTIATVLALLLSLGVLHSCSAALAPRSTRDSPPAVADPTAGQPGSQGDSTASPSSAATSLPGVSSQEYTDFRFTMPGEDCQPNTAFGPPTYPSWVVFAIHQPDVTSNPANYSSTGTYDLMLVCDDPDESGDTYIREGNGSQIAAVTGSPGEAACEAAAEGNPINGTILFSQLQPGMHFCMIADGFNELNGGSNKEQLVRLVLLSKSSTTYNLTWSATGWSIPNNSSG